MAAAAEAEEPGSSLGLASSCGSLDHRTKDCTKAEFPKNKRPCWECGIPGHIGRDCCKHLGGNSKVFSKVAMSICWITLKPLRCFCSHMLCHSKSFQHVLYHHIRWDSQTDRVFITETVLSTLATNAQPFARKKSVNWGSPRSI